jgi:hypothetical protein
MLSAIAKIADMYHCAQLLVEMGFHNLFTRAGLES